MRRPFARRTVCIDVPLNLVIAGTAGEYLTLVIAAVVVARPTSNLSLIHISDVMTLKTLADVELIDQ